MNIQELADQDQAAHEEATRPLYDEIEKLRGALIDIHDSILEYGTINNLGGQNNHEMRRARVALGQPEHMTAEEARERFPPRADLQPLEKSR